MAKEAIYTPEPERCLVLTIELDVSRAPSVLLCTADTLRKAAEAVSKTVGTVSPGALAVELVKLPDADFNSVHSLEVSFTWETVPVVVQCVPSESSGVMFFKVATCLSQYDGVAALHTVFNLAEYLEHTASGKEPEFSQPAFKVANRKEEFDEKKMTAHLEHLESLQRAAEECTFDKAMQAGLPPHSGRARLEEQLPPRVVRRVSSSATSFREFICIMSEAKARLNLSHVATPVNYSPQLALSRLPGFSEALDREKRVNGVFCPIGPPLPMNLAHAKELSYMFLFNNYGKHNPNLSLLQVKGAAWNWTGLCKCFAPVAWCATIQGKFFYLTSFAEPDQRQCHELLARIQGDAQPVTECGQPRGTMAGA
ncbi:unnamed protein product [Effrenium voratum]|nr:unnamed protein product [Effrenium voratum]